MTKRTRDIAKYSIVYGVAWSAVFWYLIARNVNDSPWSLIALLVAGMTLGVIQAMRFQRAKHEE